MHYECDKCDWEGPWDELIHETICPACRGSVSPLDDEETRQGAQHGHAFSPAGTPAQ